VASLVEQEVNGRSGVSRTTTALRAPGTVIDVLAVRIDKVELAGSVDWGAPDIEEAGGETSRLTSVG